MQGYSPQAGMGAPSWWSRAYYAVRRRGAPFSLPAPRRHLVFAWLQERWLSALLAHANIVFSSDPRVGTWVLAAVWLVPMRGIASLEAVVVSQLIWVGLAQRRSPASGGFGACGAVLAALLVPLQSGVTYALWVAGAAALCTLLTLVVADVADRLALPSLTLPFLVTGSVLASLQAVLGAGLVTAGSLFGFSNEPWVQRAFGVQLLEAFGALVLRPEPVAGAVVLAALGFGSRYLALLAAAGASIGIVTAGALGALEHEELLTAGYNSLLTCCVLGGGVVAANRRSLLLALVAAAGTSVACAALHPLFTALGIPVLAWPFVLTSLFLYRAHELAGPSWFHPPPYPTLAPERGLALARALHCRLGANTVRMYLPVVGPWCVTQGVDGGITHVGAWGFAFDFEQVDEDGFPFVATGLELGHYRCFDAWVVAPGHGTVAAIYDGQPDQPPGQQDLERPWGNAVVLQHGHVYSLLSHLRPGSVQVRVGQAVVPGQAIARCGSSGRSPRPHLHFQVQASPALGAPALPFEFVDYLAQVGSTPRTLVRRGIPSEGARVEAAEGAASAVGLELGQASWSFKDERGRQHYVRGGQLASGERFLEEAATGDRLFFLRTRSGYVFTSLDGASTGLLGTLFQVAPVLPLNDGQYALCEELPVDTLRPRFFQWLTDALRPLGGVGRAANVLMRVTARDGRVRVLSELHKRSGTTPLASGELEFDRHGIVALRQLGRRGMLRREYEQISRGNGA